MSPQAQLENKLLSQILSSATSNAFAECGYAGTCSLYAANVPTVTEEGSSESMQIGIINGQSNFVEPVNVTVTPDSQCTVLPSTFTLNVLMSDTTSVNVTAVDDSLVETSPHPCVLTINAVGGSGRFNQTITRTVNVLDNDGSSSLIGATHTLFTLFENPSQPEGFDLNTVTTNLFAPANVRVRISTDLQCNITSLTEST